MTAVAEETRSDIEVVLVDSWEEADAFKRWLSEDRDLLGLDIETTGLDPFRDEIRLVQVGDESTGWAIPWDEWRGLARDAVESYEGPMALHNAKFDVSFLERAGIEVPRERLHDTMTMLHLEDSSGPKALKPAAALRLGGWTNQGQQELKADMRRGRWGWQDVPTSLPSYWRYSAMDPVITVRLAQELWPLIQPWRDAYEREVEVTFVILDMETKGLRIDLDYCRERYQALSRELDSIGARWPDVNLNSKRQVADRLRADGVRITSRTQRGNMSLDDVVLESIDHPLAADVLEWRYREKLAKTYFAPFLELQVEGRLHPNIRPLGAEKTGRMSIGRPALQGLPRTNVVRRAVIPSDEEHVLLLADYEAQEMRMMVHCAQDPGLMEALRRGVDLHRFAASEIYGVPEDDVTKVQRTTAKWTGFAKIYGAGPPRIAATAGVTLPQAKDFLRKYDRTFPGVVRFQAEVQRRIRERDDGSGFGWVETWGGRRLVVPVDKAYKGVNYIVQGGCGDVTKDAMIGLTKAGVGHLMVLTIHDELVFDVPRADLEEVQATAREVMEADRLTVPLPTEQKVVENWGAVYPDKVDANIQKSRKTTSLGAKATEQTERAQEAWVRQPRQGRAATPEEIERRAAEEAAR